MRPADTQLLLTRTRAGLWLILGCVAFFAVVDAGIPAERFRVAYALKAANAALMLALIAVLARRPGLRVVWAIAVFAVNASYVLFAAGDLVKGHEATAPLLSLTCSMAAAALLPWGLGAQLTTAFVTTLGTVLVQRLAGASWGTLIDPVASILAAQGVAAYVVIELDRFRRDRRRVERELSGRARTEALRAAVCATFAQPEPPAARLRHAVETIARQLQVPVAAVLPLEDGPSSVHAVTGLLESEGAALARAAKALRVSEPCMATPADFPEVEAVWPHRRGLGFLSLHPLAAGARPIGLLVLAATRPLAHDVRARATAVADTLATGLVHLGAEAARTALLAELERANQVKTEFVSTMSHELRTPLNVIMGYTEMLDDPACTDPAFALSRIRQANTELLELIEATLDLNRLETGRDEPSYGDVTIAELWNELAAEFAPAAQRAGLRLDWASEPHLALRTDRRKLKTIVKNLVGNAIKFTSRGGVHVAAAEGGGHCVITVQDSGVGIPAEALPHIFEMFRQVDSSDRRSYGGVGLGLHIVQRLCRQLGAEVSVTSRPGRGTTFTVRVPLAPRVVCAA
ncbi:MAG TPA: HAMP domain-containing sensor histidine kinase [Candidatus Limnocylindria bacterium]|nr:HAMP domain-containing sensor histidine kinase [Candidatus Limnocylindria bacterium]